MITIIRQTIQHAIVYFLLCLSIFLMLHMIIEYYPLNDTTGFLRYKQDYIHNTVWKTCFYIHVFISIFVLMAGLTQFSSYVLQKHKRLHRVLGWLYVGNILFINFPAAMIMGVYANGELPGRTAFVLLDSLWFFFTLKAVLFAKRGQIRKHKEYMIRSYALTLSAIGLRSWKIILSHTTALDLHTIYIMDAWLGFVPNLLFAEWLIRKKKIKLSLKPDILIHNPE